MSKREFKSDSKPDDQNEKTSEESHTSKVIIHQTRNESVQRMFKNLKVKKAYKGGIKKQIDISDSNPVLSK